MYRIALFLFVFYAKTAIFGNVLTEHPFLTLSHFQQLVARAAAPVSPDLGGLDSYEVPEDVNPILWNAAKPYFIPLDHPIKEDLDKLFSTRIITDLSTLKKAGFRCSKMRKWNNIIVAGHSKIKGYLLKIYLDNQSGICEALNWISRVQGAKAARRAIHHFGYTKWFKAPRKWIYPLPPDSINVVEGTKKFFVLVVEDMKILDREYNENRWNHPLISPQFLEAVFHIIEEAGLYDSVYVDNMPFCRDGKVAFIDTEHFHSWPVPFHILNQYLNEPQSDYWNQLIQNWIYVDHHKLIDF